MDIQYGLFDITINELYIFELNFLKERQFVQSTSLFLSLSRNNLFFISSFDTVLSRVADTDGDEPDPKKGTKKKKKKKIYPTFDKNRSGSKHSVYH